MDVTFINFRHVTCKCIKQNCFYFHNFIYNYFPSFGKVHIKIHPDSIIKSLADISDTGSLSRLAQITKRTIMTHNMSAI